VSQEGQQNNVAVQTLPRLNASRQPLQNSCRHW